MEALVRFAHVFETLLDELRSGRKPCDETTVKSLLRAGDVLADHVQAERDGTTVDAARSAAMIAELEACIGADAAEQMSAAEIDEFGFTPVRFDEEPEFDPTLAAGPDPFAAPAKDPFAAPPAAPAQAAASAWRIVLRPRAALYAKGNDPVLLMRELERLGEIAVERIDGDLPGLDTLLVEQPYIGWSVRLVTDRDEAAIREVFEFVEHDCELEISREAAGDDAENLDLDSLLAKVGAVQAALHPRLDAASPAPAAEDDDRWTVKPKAAAPTPDDDARWNVKPAAPAADDDDRWTV
jgi:two-component system chemotaxis sensor kinase CheA